MNILTILVLSFSILFSQDEGEDIAHGPPPKPQPKTVSAAEGFPPLPLPVVPLRRSEQKRTPQPLALIAKVKYCDGVGWRGHITDLKNLLKWTRSQLNIFYTDQETRLGQFSFDPAKIPILYFTGHRRVKFSDSEIEKLRQYILNGGMIIGNSCCGNKVFAKSFEEEMRKVMPNRPFRIIQLDHPLYSSFFQISKIKYYKKGKEYTNFPKLKGIHHGCRLVIILSEADIGSGWNKLLVKESEESILPDDALKIGTNIISYVLAYRKYAKTVSKATIYESKDKKFGSEFVFAQLIHEGDWDPHPWAINNISKKMALTTLSETKLHRVTVYPSDKNIFDYPFLYITGHNDFKFRPEEINNLREYLKKGGFIFINNCCSLQEFDTAVRRELKRMFPKSDLSPIQFSHPIFFSFYNIQQLNVTEPLKVEIGDKFPTLEGISISGSLAILYSKYGLVLDDTSRPYVKTLMPQDSMKLMLNTIIYALSH